MDLEEFRNRGLEMVDYVAGYFDTISMRSVTPGLQPGDLKLTRSNLDNSSYEKIMEDFEKHVMAGIIHRQHPGYHAHEPSSSSYPAILGNMLADTLGYIGFDWESSPAGSELETIVMNWVGEMIGLPKTFLRDSCSGVDSTSSHKGAAMIQRSTSECIFTTLMTAHHNAINRLTQTNQGTPKEVLAFSLVAYCSGEAYYTIQNICKALRINLNIVDTDEHGKLRGDTLENAVKITIKEGLTPFYACITLGISSGACDPMDEIGRICEKYDIWLHVNGAYAGAAMICSEYRHLMKGIDYAASFNVNPDKWLLVDIECVALFVKNRYELIDAMIMDKTLYGYSFDEKDWGYPSKSEFRVLKLWFVIRIYGVEGLRKHVRNHIHLAKMFEAYVKNDERFEVLSCNFGIVCFRLIGSDKINRYLIDAVNATRKLFIRSCRLLKKFVIRFIVCIEKANDVDITIAWEIIQKVAQDVLKMEDEEIFSEE